MSTRQVHGGVVESLRELGESFHHGGELGLGVRRVEPVGRCEVLAYRQAGEHSGSSGDLHDAVSRDLVGGRVGDVASVEDHRTVIGLDHPADGAQERRLACAVGAEERCDTALWEIQLDVVENPNAPVSDVEAADQEKLGVSGSPLLDDLSPRQGRLADLSDVAGDEPPAAR